MATGAEANVERKEKRPSTARSGRRKVAVIGGCGFLLGCLATAWWYHEAKTDLEVALETARSQLEGQQHLEASLEKAKRRLQELEHQTELRFVEAEKAYRQVITLLEKSPVTDSKKHRQQLAEARYDLGLLLANAKRPKEAEKTYRLGLEQWKNLVNDFPDEIRYSIKLGGILNNLAIVRRDVGDFKEARSLIEQAIVHQEKALESSPDDATSRQYLKNHYTILATTLIRMSDHVKAVEAANALPMLYPASWEEHYQAASLIAWCMALVKKDASISHEKRKALARSYGDRSLALLREAMNKGFNDPEAVKKNSMFEPLRSREDFKTLMRELEQKKDSKKVAEAK